MNHEINLAPGLYLVATPIGSARDITLRALDILASADVIAAEDTRTARRLMDIHGIAVGDRPMIAYHDHNGPSARPKVLSALERGQSVAYVSEAGTPMIADPGYQLVQGAREQGVDVFAAPGASAVLAALCVSGLPTDQFFFAGFAPNAKQARDKFVRNVAQIDATLVLYESPKRIKAMLASLVQECGEDREIAICRELTKRFEEVRRGRLGDLLRDVDELTIKGEFVLVLGRPVKAEIGDDNIMEAVQAAMETMTRKDAIAHVAQTHDLPRKRVYQLALSLE